MYLAEYWLKGNNKIWEVQVGFMSGRVCADWNILFIKSLNECEKGILLRICWVREGVG